MESLTSRLCDLVAVWWWGGGQDMQELSLARDMSIITRTHDNNLTSWLSNHELLYARALLTYLGEFYLVRAMCSYDLSFIAEIAVN